MHESLKLREVPYPKLFSFDCCYYLKLSRTTRTAVGDYLVRIIREHKPSLLFVTVDACWTWTSGMHNQDTWETLGFLHAVNLHVMSLYAIMLWNELDSLNFYHLPWCLVGDFNYILNRECKRGGRNFIESCLFRALFHNTRGLVRILVKTQSGF